MDIIKFIIDFILHIDVHLAELVAQYGMWVYAILFLILFCETGLVVTPFLPGDSLLFVAGALAALPTNDLNVHTMVALMVAAAILGDAVNYTIGRLFGEKLFSNPNSKIFRRSYLDKTHQFYEKHGGENDYSGAIRADRAYFCAVRRRYGAYVLSALRRLQRDWRTGLGAALHLCWLPVRRSAGGAGEPETADRRDHHRFDSAGCD